MLPGILGLAVAGKGGTGGGGGDSEVVDDFYSESNYDNSRNLSNLNTGFGQTFTSGGGTLTKVKFYVYSFGGTPSGNCFAKIYNIASNIPSGAALATSDAVDTTTLPIGFPPSNLTTFNFSGGNQISLTNGTSYGVTFEFPTATSSSFVYMGYDSTSPTHGGQGFGSFFGSWGQQGTVDYLFYVYAKRPVIVDSYSESHFVGSFSQVDDSNLYACAQTFTSTGGTLYKATFYLAANGSPTGNMYATIYAVSGGLTGLPVGFPLATSDVVNMSVLGGSFALAEFNFSGANKITLSASTVYAVALESPDVTASNYIKFGVDSASPVHSGQFVNTPFPTNFGIWNTHSSTDSIFYVYIT